MAGRVREKSRGQVLVAVGPSLEPGEELREFVYGLQRPRGWLALDLVPFGTFIALALFKYFAVAVTDRRVFLLTRSKLSGRPRELVWAEPFAHVLVERTSPGLLQCRFDFKRRTDEKAVRLRAPRVSWKRVQEIVTAIRGG